MFLIILFSHVVVFSIGAYIGTILGRELEKALDKIL
jgi:hypothetical protein